MSHSRYRYEAISNSETELLVARRERHERRRHCCRHFCWFLSALIVLITLVFIGYGTFAYIYTRSHVQCVAYEGGTTVVKIPILYPRSAVLIDSSISSHHVTVDYVESDLKDIKFTMKTARRTETSADIRLCTMKGGKLAGLGIYADEKYEDMDLPVIDSLKVEVPSSTPHPGIVLLDPRPERQRRTIWFFKWVGVWED